VSICSCGPWVACDACRGSAHWQKWS